MLQEWAALAADFEGGALLVGNGVSRAVSESFNYKSLLAVAQSAAIAHPLRDSDCDVFDAFDTTDFETVLTNLRTADEVAKALEQPRQEIRRSYARVRRSLVEAVAHIHVEWTDVAARLDHLRATLMDYRSIYSSNYDLLLYWAVMRDPDGFMDYFWYGDFREDMVQGDDSRLLFLHGALHLYADELGRGCKHGAATSGRSLLRVFAENSRRGLEALFVSEGTSKAKMRAISTSDYLSFALREFIGESGPVVVLGHRLSPSDEHVAAALNRNKTEIAIGLLPGTDAATLRAERLRYRALLPASHPKFFDATTHPLCDPDLVGP